MWTDPKHQFAPFSSSNPHWTLQSAAADWAASGLMGNVPSTVKHCLSYEQLIEDYPWLRRWLQEDKVGVVSFVSIRPAAPHDQFMTERLRSRQTLMSAMMLLMQRPHNIRHRSAVKCWTRWRFRGCHCFFCHYWTIIHPKESGYNV